ncbi:hypothetical protein J2T60_001565 [Natronospira proteinivora]|uniref:DUF1538 domain-containing protein n=1 Tax=Natronospira proteinivora TaxID=1807133 RepID=A0ABT1G8D8_9GAMM|nr:hypothetical protein [Natronospira proteinivora]
MDTTLADFTQAFQLTLWSTLKDVAPILAVILVFQFLVLRRRIPNPWRMIKGGLYVIAGLVFFLMGLEQALFPLGRSMAEQLTAPEFIQGSDAPTDVIAHWSDYYAVYLFAFSIGAAAVMVEPAVIAVAMKAHQLSGGAIHANRLRIAIAVGVGVGIAIGSFRIVTGGSLHYFILGAYCIVIIQTLFAPRHMIPLAYDSGGVSTSTVTVPIVAALGLGLASSLPGRSPLIDGFGMIAFAVIFPVISVLAFAQIAHWRGRSHAKGDSHDETETNHRTGE